MTWRVCRPHRNLPKADYPPGRPSMRSNRCAKKQRLPLSGRGPISTQPDMLTLRFLPSTSSTICARPDLQYATRCMLAWDSWQPSSLPFGSTFCGPSSSPEPPKQTGSEMMNCLTASRAPLRASDKRGWATTKGTMEPIYGVWAMEGWMACRTLAACLPDAFVMTLDMCHFICSKCGTVRHGTVDHSERPCTC